MRLPLYCLCAQLAVVAVPVGGVRADGPSSPPPVAVPETVEEQDIPILPLVTFRQRGYFRFRADAFGQAHLHDGAREGTLVSGVLPPLGRSAANAGDGAAASAGDRDYIGTANMRFRWEPTLTVDDIFSVNAQLDVFDNMVLGSTPAWSPQDPLHPLAFWADGQASPSAGANGLDDAIRVKRAWIAWDVFHLLRVELGRMPFHWGAGALRNDGNCIDCDHGDSVDRMGFTAGPFDFDLPGLSNLYVSFAWDFPGEGSILASSWSFPSSGGGAVLGAGPASGFGQPVDGTQLDDVNQYVVSVESRARSATALRERERRLEEDRRPVVEWGWLNVFRTEDYGVDLPESVGGAGICDTYAHHTTLTDPRIEVPFDCTRLYPRDAFTWTTDLWLRLDWRPAPGEAFSFEIEMAGVLLGNVGQTSALRNEDTSKDVWGGGAIVRSAYSVDALEVGVEVGVASGDPDAAYFGVRDGSNAVVSAEAAGTDIGRSLRRDPTYTQFAFNRDYFVDLLLFREVIGAVTNTIYARPSASYDFFELAGYTVGGRLSALYAAAMFPEGTPGGGRHLGFETDAQIYVRAAPHFLGIVEGGLLVPLDAFDVPSLPAPDLAWTVQLRLNLMF